MVGSLRRWVDEVDIAKEYTISHPLRDCTLKYQLQRTALRCWNANIVVFNMC